MRAINTPTRTVKWMYHSEIMGLIGLWTYTTPVVENHFGAASHSFATTALDHLDPIGVNGHRDWAKLDLEVELKRGGGKLEEGEAGGGKAGGEGSWRRGKLQEGKLAEGKLEERYGVLVSRALDSMQKTHPVDQRETYAAPSATFDHQRF
ncbi:hypothetical protein Btru_023671 [Bulinus truncatus]|nr:hypothetical protein Btru_023671 [Bulinus truncatus]